MTEMNMDTLKLWQSTEYNKVAGKMSHRAILMLGRAYHYGNLDKPLEEVTDAKFLSYYGLGKKTLAEIRQVIPPPGE